MIKNLSKIAKKSMVSAAVVCALFALPLLFKLLGEKLPFKLPFAKGGVGVGNGGADKSGTGGLGSGKGEVEGTSTKSTRTSEQKLTNTSEKDSVFSPLLKPLVFTPKYLNISKIGVKNVKIVEIGLEGEGRLEVPKSFNEAGWYKDGPKAGEEGNAIIAAHYDRATGAPAVFYSLGKLTKGDKVEVIDEVEKVWEFEVYETGYVNINDPQAVTKAYENTSQPILTLITCGGVWDPIAHDYNKRLLVKARRV